MLITEKEVLTLTLLIFETFYFDTFSFWLLDIQTFNIEKLNFWSLSPFFISSSFQASQDEIFSGCQVLARTQKMAANNTSSKNTRSENTVSKLSISSENTLSEHNIFSDCQVPSKAQRMAALLLLCAAAALALHGISLTHKYLV